MLSSLRPSLSAALTRLDENVARLADLAKSQLLWPILYAVAAGSAAWMLAHPSRIAEVDTNKVTLAESTWMLVWVGVALAVLLLVYAGTLAWERRRTGAWRTFARVRIYNGWLRPLLAAPFVTGLTQKAIEKDFPRVFACVAIAAIAVGSGVYAWIKSPAPQPAPEPAPPQPAPEPAPPEPAADAVPAEPGAAPQGETAAPQGETAAPQGETAAALDAPASKVRAILGKVSVAAAVGALWAGYAVFFSYLSITNHHALNTRSIDLAYYDNAFYQSIHGRPLACSLLRAGTHIAAHFDPIIVVLSPLYLIYPRAEGILALQAIWLGSGVIPVYLLAKDKLGKPVPSIVLAAMYALYPALHGANMYEFHSLTLLSPILLWVLFFLERGNWRGYWIAVVFALLVREDVPLILCFVGLYSILSGRPRGARNGWVTIVLSLLYFGVAKGIFMSTKAVLDQGKDSYSYAYYYEDLIPNKNGLLGLAVSLLTNPWFVLKHVLTEAKIQYFLTIFLPVGFLPFFAKKGRIMLVYGLAFCFLASRSAVFSPSFQYSSVLVPFAFALTPMALKQIQDAPWTAPAGLDGLKLSRALLGLALACSLIWSWKYGGLLENQTFRGGFGRVARGLGPRERARYDWLRAAVARIPPDGIVTVTNVTGCHVSNRKEVYFYPYATTPETQWFLLDEAELKGNDLERHKKNIQQGKLEELTRHDKLVLFRRKEPKPTEPGAVRPP